jgi:AhpD family alkylhydroperoxidase
LGESESHPAAGWLTARSKGNHPLLVSKDNACAYCIDAHAAALHMLGFSPQDVAAMEHTLGDTHFSSREQALIDFARRANREANRMAADLKRLSAQDIPMAEVIEALGVMELFAAFNRFADALGVVPDSFPSPQQ